MSERYTADDRLDWLEEDRDIVIAELIVALNEISLLIENLQEKQIATAERLKWFEQEFRKEIRYLQNVAIRHEKEIGECLEKEEEIGDE